MEIKEVPISDIKPYERNPRKNDSAVKAVAKSIQEFGFRQPIVADKDGVIIVGHTRYKAAKKLGLKTIPVHYADFDEQKAKAYRLADNKTNELSDWDFDLLGEELKGILNFDMTDFGFDELTKETSGIIEDEPPEVDEAKEPIAKIGDVWQLGLHRLICGDSTDESTIKRLMNGEKADITITSPPYGMGRTSHLRKHLKRGESGRDGLSFYGASSDDSNGWADLIEDFYQTVQNAASVHFVNIMMVADNKKPLIDFVAAHSSDLVDIIVWNKHSCPPQIHERVLNNGYEFVFVFDNEQSTRSIRFGDFRGTKSNYIETKKEQNRFADIHKAVFRWNLYLKLLIFAIALNLYLTHSVAQEQH